MSISIPPGADAFALLGQLRADLKASLLYVVAWMAIVVFDYVESLFSTSLHLCAEAVQYRDEI
jgi:hypothetical protein